MRKKVNWENLIDDRCPKCDESLEPDVPGMRCSNEDCKFFITHQKKGEIEESFGL